MFVKQLWRYPVKSMGGEQLDRCHISPDGIPRDRVVHVEDRQGKVVTSRSRPRLLLHRGRLDDDGEPLVDERPWGDPSVADDVRVAAGETARLVRWTGPERFDVWPLLVATDGALASLGYDARRFRPNIIIGDVSGLAERSWEGRRLSVGEAVIEALALNCRIEKAGHVQVGDAVRLLD